MPKMRAGTFFKNPLRAISNAFSLNNLKDRIKALEEDKKRLERELRFASFRGRFTQGARGDFRESSHAALDRLLTTSREKNLRVILTLTNYWPDYGGIDRYVEWAREDGDANAKRREDFYTSTKCRDAFAKYVEFLAGRRNTITGELYRDDPTIFSYQLINEPRVRGDTSDGALFEEWVRTFAETIRRVDGGR